MYQVCCIAAAAKKALKNKSALSYIPVKYENKIQFQFLPEKKLFITRTHKSENVTTWYDYCSKKKLQDIIFLAPIAVNNRNILGFSNTSQSSLVCFWGNKVTYFTAQWEADSLHKMWNVLYVEKEWKDAPCGRPHFENNLESFKSVLNKIRELACKIDCNNFALVFQKALDILSGSSNYPDTEYNLPLPEIPQENLPLFEAASTADVFGAMGSWNDSPPCLAYRKGMDKQYEILSGELFKQVRLATLYAINEW